MITIQAFLLFYLLFFGFKIPLKLRTSLQNNINNLIKVGLGFQELIRPVLSNIRDQFERMNVKKEEVVEIENPVSEEYSCLRVWLLPDLMKVLSVNKHVEYPQKLFEIGDVVKVDEKEGTCTKEERKLACIISDSKVGYEMISSVVDSLMNNLGLRYKLKRKEYPSFIAGRCAEVSDCGWKRNRYTRGGESFSFDFPFRIYREE